MYVSESSAALHEYKHIAGNPLKLNTPVRTYLNEVDKHTANYACSGFGEKSAASFPTTKTWFALQIKALSGSTRPCGEQFWLCFFFFFFDDLSRRTSKWQFLKSSTFMMHCFVIGPDMWCQSFLFLISVWICLTPIAHQSTDFLLTVCVWLFLQPSYPYNRARLLFGLLQWDALSLLTC